MQKETQNSKNEEPLSFKINLFKYLNENQPENNWPNFNLIFNYNEIKFILKKSNNKQLTKILYYNKDTIDKILYDVDEIIKIETNRKLFGLSYYFYLTLLIGNNPSVINYIYSINLIKEINEQKTINNKKIYKKLIILIIVLKLINYYKSTDYYEEKEKNELNIIEEDVHKDILQIKQSNSKFFEDLDYQQIDVIYIKIIINAIKSNQNYNDILIILDQLDLENINMTKNMFQILSKFLNNKNNIKKYNISQIGDLFNKRIIMFYFILFKYLLKNICYIFQIKFLYKIRNRIIKLIKKNNNFIILYNKSSNDIKEKLKFILKSFLDSDYYLDLLNSNDEKIEVEIQENFQTINPLNDYIEKNNNNQIQNENDNNIKNNSYIISNDSDSDYNEYDSNNSSFRDSSDSRDKNEKLKDLSRASSEESHNSKTL